MRNTASEPICSCCGDSARDVTAAFLEGRPGRWCYCDETERLDALDEAARRVEHGNADEDAYLERMDRAVDDARWEAA